MKFSEAMLKGCEFVPKCRRVYADTDIELEITSTCAIGAAAHGILGREAPIEEVLAKASSIFASLKTQEQRDILFWNDTMDASREEIAARLAERGL